MPFTGRTSPNPTTGSFRIGRETLFFKHAHYSTPLSRHRPPASPHPRPPLPSPPLAAVENYTPPRAPAIAIAVRTDRQARGDPAPRRWVRDKNPVFGYLSATRFWRGSSIMVADIYCWLLLPLLIAVCRRWLRTGLFTLAIFWKHIL